MAAKKKTKKKLEDSKINLATEIEYDKDVYQVSVRTNGVGYNAQAGTIEEALSLIPIFWTGVKTKGMVTVTQGDKTVQKFLPLLPLRKLMLSKFKKIIFAKQLNEMLRME